jgi:hypothetical protein
MTKSAKYGNILLGWNSEYFVMKIGNTFITFGCFYKIIAYGKISMIFTIFNTNL